MSLSIMSLNVLGLSLSKSEAIKRSFLQNDLVFLQETKAGKPPFHITHKTIHTQDKTNKRGLMIVYNSNKIKISNLQIIDPDRLIIADAITNTGKRLKIANIYNHNTGKEKQELLEDLLKIVRAYQNETWVIAGDFNASKNKNHTDNDNICNTINDICDQLEGNSYPNDNDNREDHYTIDRYGKRVIDYIISNSPILSGSVDHLTLLSDHYPLHVTLDIKIHQEQPKLFRKYKAKDKEELEQKCRMLEQKVQTIEKGHHNNATGNTRGLEQIYDTIVEQLTDRKEVIPIIDSKYNEEIDKIEEKKLDISMTTSMKDKMTLRKELRQLTTNLESKILADRITTIQNIVKKGNRQTRTLIYNRKKQSTISKIKIDEEWITDEGKINHHLIKHFQHVVRERDPMIHHQTTSPHKPIENCDKILSNSLNGKEINLLFHNLKDTAPGEDGIRATTLKWITKETREIIVKWVNGVLKIGIPGKVKNATIIPIQKRDNPETPSHYRGITLLSTMYKLVTKIINIRINKMVKERLYCRQFGGRRGRSTTDSSILLQNIIALGKLHGKFTHFLRLDIEKAFDSVPIRLISDAMTYFGMNDQSITQICQLINNTPTKVRINGKYSETFVQNSGVKQGDVLSPSIFIMALDYIIQPTASMPGMMISTRNKQYNVSSSAFMDDTEPIADNQAKLIALFDEINTRGKRYGLSLNTAKTIYWTNEPGIEGIAMNDGTFIPKSKWIERLGNPISTHGGAVQHTVTNKLREKLQTIRTYFMTIEQIIAIINSDCIPMVDFLLTQAKSLDLAEEANKIIKDFISENFKIDRNMKRENWHKPVNEFGLGLKDLRIHHAKTMTNSVRKQMNIKDVDSSTNSTRLFIREFERKFQKNPIEDELSSNEKECLPQYISKMREITKIWNVNIHNKMASWKEVGIKELIREDNRVYKIVQACTDAKKTKMADIFINTSQNSVSLKPKKEWYDSIWDFSNSKRARGWNFYTKVAQATIDTPRIKMRYSQEPVIVEPLNGNDYIFATDGSYEDNEGGIGIVSSSHHKIFMKAHHPTSSFDCEIQAICHICRITQDKQITIITDSWSSIQAIQSKTKTNNEWINEARKHKHRIQFQFIKAHMAIEDHEEKDQWNALLNQEADELANWARISNDIPTIQWPAIPNLIYMASDQIIYDLDHEISNQSYPRVKTNIKKSWRKTITPQSTLSKNDINICIRAFFNCLPVTTKFGNTISSCPLGCWEPETTHHAILQCIHTKESRDKLKLETIEKISNLTKIKKEQIIAEWPTITDPSNPHFFLGYIPNDIVKLWKITTKETSQLIRSYIMHFVANCWRERCNHFHNT